MPKSETIDIQKTIVDLGQRLGFDAVMEERIHNNDYYAPIYDVVWYLDLEKQIDFSALEPLYKNSPALLTRMKKLPFAGFEIEGGDVSTKKQIGNFANLHAGNFLFNFEIVNSTVKGSEDIYRRGLKIFRYANEILGERNDFFADISQIEESIRNFPVDSDNKIHIGITDSISRKDYGGENEETAAMFNEIFPMLQRSGLFIRQNTEPDICRLKFMAKKQTFSSDNSGYGKHLLGQAYYEDPKNYIEKIASKTVQGLYAPKTDIEAGFLLPDSFLYWLKELGKAMHYDAVNYPLIFGASNNLIKEYFVSLIGIELESKVNKHLNGGLCNMYRYSYTGILATEETSDSHIKFLQNELGINNITSYICGGAR